MNQSITGMCVSPGRVTGTLTWYTKGKTYTKSDIVVLNEWVTSGVVLLKNAGGLISERGGLTCHASIISREYGIPCLVSAKGLQELHEGDHVTLDATNESIEKHL